MRAKTPNTEPECRRVGTAAAFAGIMMWAVAFTVASVAPGATQEPACAAPAAPMRQIELLFGRRIDADARFGALSGARRVGDTAWSRFLAREVTPRFPDGLTVIDAAGQWRDPTGRIAREASKLVIIVTADSAAADKIAAVVSAYKEHFHQRSVGVVTRPVCAAF